MLKQNYYKEYENSYKQLKHCQVAPRSNSEYNERNRNTAIKIIIIIITNFFLRNPIKIVNNTKTELIIVF